MRNIKTLPDIIKFCATIGNLPTSYMESLTYEEQLLWLLNFLNKTILPTIHETIDSVEELENWFNNLDVQEEINNKLDAMVESGELQEIISEYLNSTAIFGFDTVEDMKEATNLINGSYAKTLGKNTLNDGYGETYKIRTITNEDIVDNDIIIAMDDPTLVAEKIKKFSKYQTSTIHLSFDDIQLSLQNLQNNDYTSLFDEPFFAMLKELHDKYNAIFSLYVYTDYFNAITKTIYKQDFINNADWLKIGFHATNGSSNFASTNYLTAKSTYNTFIENVLRICGTNLIIDRVPRLANFAGSHSALQGLINAKNGVIGLLDADDDRISYNHNAKICNFLKKNYEFYNHRDGLYFIRTNFRIENSSNLTDDLNDILESENGTNRNIEVFSHEVVFYNGTVISNKNKLVEVCEWVKSHNIPYQFVQNKIPNNNGASVIPNIAKIPINRTDGTVMYNYTMVENTTLGGLKFGFALNNSGMPTCNGTKQRIGTNTLLVAPQDTHKIYIHNALENIDFNLVELTCKEVDPINITPNGYSGTQWNTCETGLNEITLQDDTEYYMICFRKHDNAEFAESDLLANNIYVGYL